MFDSQPGGSKLSLVTVGLPLLHRGLLVLPRGCYDDSTLGTVNGENVSCISFSCAQETSTLGTLLKHSPKDQKTKTTIKHQHRPKPVQQKGKKHQCTPIFPQVSSAGVCSFSGRGMAETWEELRLLPMARSSFVRRRDGPAPSYRGREVAFWGEKRKCFAGKAASAS